MNQIKLIRRTGNVGTDWKYLLELSDGSVIEAALFKHHSAVHFCVPTQVGCGMRCRHCSTTYARMPFVRNMESAEMISMIRLMQQDLWKTGLPLILSFSGHGEPMLNWNNVADCVRCLGKDYQKTYVTSIGICKTMKSILEQESFMPDIYFSIHGASDEERIKLIPSVGSHEVADLRQIIDFGEQYVARGGRIVWNYMLWSENSSEESVRELIRLCKEVRYPVEIRMTNYISIHGNLEMNGAGDAAEHFYQMVSDQLPDIISVRRSILEGEGDGIACGQMRAYAIENLVNDNNS